MTEFLYNILDIVFPLCVIMILMFIIDTVSGVINARKEGTFQSTRLRDCIPKFLMYDGFILMAVMIDFIFYFYFKKSDVIPDFLKALSAQYPFTVGCKLFIIFTEAVSFVENCRKYGIKIPKFIDKLLNKSIEILDDEGDEK